MRVSLQELPGHRSFELGPEYVGALLVDLPMRSALGTDAGQAGAGKAELDFYLDRDNVIVSGHLEAWVELACSRCLARVRLVISETISACYLPTTQLSSAAATDDSDHEELGESDDTYGYDGDEIDVEPVLQERLLLSLPFAPLCSEQCIGLCSQCGADLNKTECGCDRKVIDPRLASLKDIKV